MIKIVQNVIWVTLLIIRCSSDYIGNVYVKLVIFHSFHLTFAIFSKQTIFLPLIYCRHQRRPLDP